MFRGPSDVIHDLHAKYETAVNKAERVAEEAIKFTAESLNEQVQFQFEIFRTRKPLTIGDKRIILKNYFRDSARVKTQCWGAHSSSGTMTGGSLP